MPKFPFPFYNPKFRKNMFLPLLPKTPKKPIIPLKNKPMKPQPIKPQPMKPMNPTGKKEIMKGVVPKMPVAYPRKHIGVVGPTFPMEPGVFTKPNTQPHTNRRFGPQPAEPFFDRPVQMGKPLFTDLYYGLNSMNTDKKWYVPIKKLFITKTFDPLFIHPVHMKHALLFPKFIPSIHAKQILSYSYPYPFSSHPDIPSSFHPGHMILSAKILPQYFH